MEEREVKIKKGEILRITHRGSMNDFIIGVDDYDDLNFTQEVNKKLREKINAKAN